MKAEEYLTQVHKLVKLIRNKKAERELWFDIATGTTKPISPDKVQSSGNPQKMADAVCNKLGVQDIIDQAIEELEKKYLEITSTLEMLNDVHYDVLHLLYIQNIPLEDVAARYGKSRRWATNKRGIALRSLQRILDERERRTAEKK